MAAYAIIGDANMVHRSTEERGELARRMTGLACRTGGNVV